MQVFYDSAKLDVTDEGIKIKFDSTVKISSITLDKFTLYPEANPLNLVPFLPIEITRDYDSIGRILTLYFAASLAANTTFVFSVSGLVNVAGNPVEDNDYNFITGDVEVSPPEIPEEPKISIIDYSIKSAFNLDNSLFSANPEFYVTDTDPPNGSYFLDEDYNNGRVTVKFSKDPDPRFLNSPWIKAQRKKFTHIPTRWETIGVNIAKHSNKPWVFIDFPSSDATPVFVQSGHDYFSPSYKYRIILSKDITT